MKIGVFGVGHLGKIHIKCIQSSELLDLVGFYDPDIEKSKLVAEELGVQAFDTVAELMQNVDIVDIVSPTVTHFELAKDAIENGKHVFIEKPLTHTVEEGAELIKMIEGTGLKVQVGHVERFNPALLTLENTDLSPMFIEGHRLAQFNPRGTDVSVILDLMIHDIDIILNMVKSPVKQINASGVAVVSDTLDIANARIEFENGCVANLTASRISLKKMRKLRLFQKDAYISLDFLDKEAQILRLYDKATASISEGLPVFELETNQGTKLIHVEIPEIPEVNAIKMELEALVTAIEENRTPKVDIHAGFQALKVAHQIMEAIK